MHTLVMDLEPGYIGTEPGFLYRFNRDLYETITSSHLTLNTKQGRIKNFKLSGVTRQVETTGAQLFDASKIPTTSSGGATVTNNGDGSFTVSGNGTITSGFSHAIYLENEDVRRLFRPGEIYMAESPTATRPYFEVGFFKNDQNVCDIRPVSAFLKATLPDDFFAPENNLRVKYIFYGASGLDIIPGTIKPMLYQDGDGTWEPYTGTQSSPSPEYPQDIQGVGVRTNNEPYGYRTDVVCRTEDDTESYTAPIYTQSPVYQGDKIEYRNGEYGLVRKNGLLTDNGALAWTKYTGGGSCGVNRCFRISVPDMINYPDSVVAANAKLDLLCNRLPSGVFVGRDKPVSVGYSEGQLIYIRLDDDKYADIDTVDQFKAWLADHPVEILYPLEQEVWEPLPAISQQALRNLPTYKGTTIIDTTDPLAPEITVSYRAQTDYSKLPGLEVDYEKCTTTRLGAAKNLTAGPQFNRFPMYAGRRRCNVSDNGTITAYVGDHNYREDGSNGQVMVYQPKFYYQVVPLKTDPQTDGIGYHLRRAQYWVSPKPQPEFKLHPAFINASGQEVDHILLSAYESSLYDTSALAYILDDAQVMDVAADKLSSIAGAKPASGKTQQFTRPNVEQLAQNRGPGWHGDTIKAESANQLLMAIELGAMNTQAAIGQGVVSILDTPNTENNSIITGGTSSLGNNTGMANGDNGKVSVSYRGMENPWGNIWKFVYGVNIWGDGTKKGGVPYICTDFNYAENKNSENYESAGFTLSNENGYISAMGYSEAFDWLFMPSETVGNSSLPVGDYLYITPNLNGYKIAPLGGSWGVSSGAGAFCWRLGIGVGTRDRYVGGRLVYVPQ